MLIYLCLLFVCVGVGDWMLMYPSVCMRKTDRKRDRQTHIDRNRNIDIDRQINTQTETDINRDEDHASVLCNGTEELLITAAHPRFVALIYGAAEVVGGARAERLFS